MITFSNGFEKLGFGSGGAIDEVPTNSYLREVHIDRAGVVVIDIYGNWGYIRYQDTSFSNNIAVFNYLYPFTQINKVVTVKTEICSADLQTANSIPIELVPQTEIGLIVNPIGFAYFYRYKSVVFDFAQNLFVHASTNSDSQAFFQITTSVINAAGNRSSVASIITGDGQLIENDSLVLKAKTSDATQGDGYLTVYTTYSIIEEAWRDGVYCV